MSARRTRAVKLMAAAALIEEALTDLDPKARVCPCCGLTVNENHGAFRALQALGETPSKIRRLVNTDSVKKELDK